MAVIVLLGTQELDIWYFCHTRCSMRLLPAVRNGIFKETEQEALPSGTQGW